MCRLKGVFGGGGLFGGLVAAVLALGVQPRANLAKDAQGQADKEKLQAPINGLVWCHTPQVPHGQCGALLKTLCGKGDTEGHDHTKGRKPEDEVSEHLAYAGKEHGGSEAPLR